MRKLLPVRRVVGLLAALPARLCIILLVGAALVDKLYEMGIVSAGYPIPRWIPFIMLPIGLALCLLRLLQIAWRTARSAGRLQLADEAAKPSRRLRALEDAAVETHPAAGSPPEDHDLPVLSVLFVLLLMGVPIAFSLGLSSILTILFFTNDSLASMAFKLFETMEHYTLLAIPFFILSSAFLTTGGVARRLIRFAIAAVGHLQGGLAIASVLACMLFAAVSGSSPATVAAIGSIVIGAW